jgi:hypothetical protein
MFNVVLWRSFQIYICEGIYYSNIWEIFPYFNLNNWRNNFKTLSDIYEFILAKWYCKMEYLKPNNHHERLVILLKPFQSPKLLKFPLKITLIWFPSNPRDNPKLMLSCEIISVETGNWENLLELLVEEEKMWQTK